jgi:hypothetical protein
VKKERHDIATYFAFASSLLGCGKQFIILKTFHYCYTFLGLLGVAKSLQALQETSQHMN